MIQTTKDIEINGVNLRLYKFDPFKQQRIINTVGPALINIVVATYALQKSKAEGAEIFEKAVSEFFKTLPDKARNDLIFNDLLGDDAIKIVVQGTEMPLIGKAPNGAKTVMNSELNDLIYLYEAAFASFKFNFTTFFSRGSSLCQNPYISSLIQKSKIQDSFPSLSPS